MNKCDAAEFLGISVSTLEKLMKEERIPYKAVGLKGRKVLFQKGDLVKWARTQKLKKLD